jgi:hypothetical protein
MQCGLSFFANSSMSGCGALPKATHALQAIVSPANFSAHQTRVALSALSCGEISRSGWMSHCALLRERLTCLRVIFTLQLDRNCRKDILWRRCARVAELADALDLGSSGQPWGFESPLSHQCGVDSDKVMKERRASRASLSRMSEKRLNTRDE